MQTGGQLSGGGGQVVLPKARYSAGVVKRVRNFVGMEGSVVSCCCSWKGVVGQSIRADMGLAPWGRDALVFNLPGMGKEEGTKLHPM